MALLAWWNLARPRPTLACRVAGSCEEGTARSPWLMRSLSQLETPLLDAAYRSRGGRGGRGAFKLTNSTAKFRLVAYDTSTGIVIVNYR